MAYKALYRTYRPQQFLEVAGQQTIVKTLQNALKNQKLSHAYLFAGPRGTGKTTLAKIFAKALNCQTSISEPCGTCDNCMALQENRHPDIIEIDAASNNGVDEVRDLIDKVKYAPIKGKYKVYIIDEVHMMTSGAFNALLKTLEEPPSHVIFILATTEPHKIIPTILSRCQRFDFGKVNTLDLKQRLQLILEKEHIPYNDQAIQAVIQLADGGVRDALSMLDQVIAYTGGTFTEKDILQLFGLVSVDEKLTFLKAIGEQDQTTIVGKIDHFVSLGIDFKRLLNDLLMMLKDALILVKTQQPSLMNRLDEPQANSIIESLPLPLFPLLTDSFFSVLNEVKNASLIPGILQLNLLQLKRESQVNPSPQATILEVMKPTPKKINSTSNTNKESIFIDDVNMIKVMVSGDKDQRLEVVHAWKHLEEKMMDATFAELAALLKDARPYVLSKQILTLEVEQISIAQQLNLVSNQALLQSLIQSISGYQGLIYTIHKQEAVKLKKLYKDLSDLNKLPAKQDHAPTVKNWTFE